jgi:uncharacterized SAM-binding protein YcdF (DUF218 family)
MFILKKVVSRFLFPISLVLELVLMGAFLKRGKKFLVAGAVLLYLFSFKPVPFLLLYPLERQYPVQSLSSLNQEVRWVIVLGGGSQSGKFLPPQDQLSGSTLKRLLEGLRICRSLPKAKVVMSGGDYRGLSLDAPAMQNMALAIGFPRERMILEARSWDTIDQARALNQLVGAEPFYLVTSASHMSRAMAMFQKLGARPIAAPTDFNAVWEPFRIMDLFPQAGALSDTEKAFYEYLGLLWGWIKGYV